MRTVPPSRAALDHRARASPEEIVLSLSYLPQAKRLKMLGKLDPGLGDNSRCFLWGRAIYPTLDSTTSPHVLVDIMLVLHISGGWMQIQGMGSNEKR